MLRHIPQRDFVEGRWRNGLGVSWDIASAGVGEDFDWRLALARIDSDVAFSVYGPVDRVFTLLDGEGLALDFGAGKVISVDRLHVPHAFACDVPLFCRMVGRGPALALNLFTARQRCRARVEVVPVDGVLDIALAGDTTLFMALQGSITLASSDTTIHAREGDAVVAASAAKVRATGQGGVLYVGHVSRLT